MTTPSPVIHFNFENQGSITNIGTLGRYITATLYGTCSVISSDYATGTSCLSLIGGSSSSGGYLQISNFDLSLILGYQALHTSICFWFKKKAVTISETNARILDFYYNRSYYIRFFFDSNGCLNFQKNDMNGEFSCVITAKVCDGGWHHIAVVNDYPNLIIYFDGLFYYSVNTFGASCMYSSTLFL